MIPRTNTPKPRAMPEVPVTAYTVLAVLLLHGELAARTLAHSAWVTALDLDPTLADTPVSA